MTEEVKYNNMEALLFVGGILIVVIITSLLLSDGDDHY